MKIGYQSKYGERADDEKNLSNVYLTLSEQSLAYDQKEENDNALSVSLVVLSHNFKSDFLNDVSRCIILHSLIHLVLLSTF